jgi:hypothetical protein
MVGPSARTPLASPVRARRPHRYEGPTNGGLLPDNSRPDCGEQAVVSLKLDLSRHDTEQAGVRRTLQKRSPAVRGVIVMRSNGRTITEIGADVDGPLVIPRAHVGRCDLVCRTSYISIGS